MAVFMSIQTLSLAELVEKAQALLAKAELPQTKRQLQELENLTLQSDFWNRGDAKHVMSQLGELQEKITTYTTLSNTVADLAALQELNTESAEGSNTLLSTELDQLTVSLSSQVKTLEFATYLSGTYDRCRAYISIHPGQGGTEATDWAEMLMRMYKRFFERKNWKYSLISEVRGEEAGIKEAAFEVQASYAYGYLKREQGTHRLVRLSPFNADSLRQTSFALVEILPLLDETQGVEVKEADLSWNFSRAGGAGGQNVNKVNSAVELTHIPTGTVVRCREERSQVQNKARALQILRAKLALIQEAEREKELAQTKGVHQNASWGTQIRNYVLHPYHLVKDTRTEVETSDTDAVLDGDLDLFIEAELRLD